MTARVFAVLLMAFCGLTLTSAHAQTIDPGAEGQIASLVPPRHGARICFSRQYNAAHLQNHPDQMVRSIAFRLTYYRHQADADYPRGQRNYYFSLRARLRSGPPLESSGECLPMPDGRNIACMVECDGGGIIVRRSGTKGQLLVDLEATGGIRMTRSCDDEEGVELLPGLDDKRFLLSEMAPESCPQYEDW